MKSKLGNVFEKKEFPPPLLKKTLKLLRVFRPITIGLGGIS